MYEKYGFLLVFLIHTMSTTKEEGGLEIFSVIRGEREFGNIDSV